MWRLSHLECLSLRYVLMFTHKSVARYTEIASHTARVVYEIYPSYFYILHFRRFKMAIQ